MGVDDEFELGRVSSNKRSDVVTAMWSAEDRRRLAELEAEDDRLRAEHAEWNAAQSGIGCATIRA